MARTYPAQRPRPAHRCRRRDRRLPHQLTRSDGLILNQPLEIRSRIAAHLLPENSLIFVTSRREIRDPTLDVAHASSPEAWIYVLFQELAQVIIGQHDATYIPPTLGAVLHSISGAVQSSALMRDMTFDFLFRRNKNWFLFTNTPSCIEWVHKHGSRYIPYMNRILFVLIYGPPLGQGNPIAIYDAMDTVTGIPSFHGYGWSNVNQRPYYISNSKHISKRLLEPQNIVNAVLQAGANTDHLGFVNAHHMFGDQPDTTVNGFNIDFSQPMKQDRIVDRLYGFDSAMRTLARIPTPNPIRMYCMPMFKSHPPYVWPYPRDELNDPNAQDWPIDPHGKLEMEAMDACESIGKRLDAFVIPTVSRDGRDEPYATLHPPRRYQPRRAKRARGGSWRYPV
ncbi:hypothetical protein BGZ63DRAFT_425672 [Mariannaea sp. PMI_226]|nr:hypothetical protein BGZ63DRAFT_425672 [Mariannaea sp. PMI_226]